MKSPLSVLLALSTALSGCTTFSKDGGFDTIAGQTQMQLDKEVRWPRSEAERTKSANQVAALMTRPLSVDDAVQIALLNSPALQASFEELAISESDLVQSGRLPNPRFTLRHASADGLYDIEETLTFNVLALLTVPYAHATEKRRFAQIQDAVVIEVIQRADRTRTAYYTALAARESLHYAWQVKNAAQTSAEMAHRMLGAGNWSRIDQARQQSFYTQAMQDLARAQLVEESSRDELNRLLGIGDAKPGVQLAAELPALPANIASLPNLEQTAMQSRVDLQLKRAELEELARRLNLTKATRFVNVLDAGPARVREGTRDDPFEKGYEVSFEIPIFDTGDARVHRAESQYAQSADRLAQAAIDARSEVRKAAAEYRATYEIAVREREEVLPLRKMVLKQDLLRYNASQISVFDLLADAREQIASVNDYSRSVRDFWIAKSRLDTALLANPSR
jgi:outer membrane protein TolC